MKKIVLLVALMVAAGGAYADTLSTQTATEPEVQVAEIPQAEAVEVDEALSSELATEIEAALEDKKVDCPFGAPSCTPFNLEPCEEYCGPGFGACYRWCCVCTG
jgi:hypothetical protein